MTDNSPEIILHHYDPSAFSEKPRKALGIKGLAWNSVKVPSVLPKPDLMPLTGGYRKTPVMQIGADIYCDTRIMMRVLEERYPTPTLYPGGKMGMPFGLGFWADTAFFKASRTIAFAFMGDKLPEAFIQDREAMTGEDFQPAKLKPLEAAARAQWRCFAGWISDHLQDGKPWIMGDAPGLADINAFMNVWFLRGRAAPIAETLLEEYPIVRKWADAMEAIGYGNRQDMTAEQALDIAKNSEPTAVEHADARDPQGLRPGDRVTVTPIDYGKDAVEGHIISLSAQHITIGREHERVGKVAVHFPRVGFDVQPL